MSIDIEKDTKCNQDEDCCNSKKCDTHCCSLNIKIGGDREKPGKTDYQQFCGHLANICWILFLAALILSWGTQAIVGLFIAAIVFEEFN